MMGVADMARKRLDTVSREKTDAAYAGDRYIEQSSQSKRPLGPSPGASVER